MSWYLQVLKKYAVFSGRARRREYWYFVLFNIIISIIIMIFETALKTMGALSVIYFLAVLLPGLAVSVRRLHDTNHSGWWIFISLVPLVGSIILLVFMVTDSDKEANEYGPSPKADNGQITQNAQMDATEQEYLNSLKQKGFSDSEIEREITRGKQFAKKMAEDMYKEKNK